MALSQSRDILIRMSQHYKDIKFINASERGILHGGNIELKTIDQLLSAKADNLQFQENNCRLR